LGFITSYENRVSAVEEMITTAYEVMAVPDENSAELDEEGRRLKDNLREVLAKSCSLRRKDFDGLIGKLLSDIEMRKREIEEERKQVNETLKEYLTEQKELTTSLKEQLVKFSQGKASEDECEALLADIKDKQENRGQQTLAMLRKFQLHLKFFQSEKEEINHKLQRLADRGELLKVEDLRQLESAKASEKRRAERKLRREDVERLLSHFRQHRDSAHL